ncbi:2-oxo acid dehydrogenase subunit E2 [Vagococcus fluvialis]|uniref:2-oxo acid dehydrogenase subunit E2 n=1 Tax=Vagococcus fluvialis TaxID=2738 RepID=UPI001A8FBB6B|nr:2-oxo acid dehydrogenase subunit E2 [Vagococcus fluvialis]MBO0436912.1 2-oxo acid dehydrogenase subunit E2 [Vagococcus fluvialis]
MAYIFKLPDVGEGLVEADIIQWLVKEGDVVKEDDALVEIQNDKSSMEIPSPVSGVVTKILVPVGVAKVDEAIIEIETGEATTEEATPVAQEVVETTAPSTGNYVFELPDVGEGLVEAEIIQWLVKEGDVIKADDALVEIQNDKSSMEIPSPVSGIVVKILVPEGIAKVDEGIIEIKTGESEPSNQVTTPVQEAPKAAKEVASTDVAIGKPSAKVRALPSVRRYSRQQQVDLSQVTPTGPNGKILKVDVDTFLNGGGAAVVTETVATPTTIPATEAPVAAKAASKPAPVLAHNEDWVEKMTPTRRAIAKAMVTSRTEIPHVTVFDKLRTEKLMEHRNTYKEIAKEENVRLTFLPYVVKAMVAMLKAYPSLNASVNMEKSEIIHRGNINIGIATNTDHGLFVPVIKNADRKSVFEIAEEIDTLAKKAMANELTREDMSGSSATITNIGGMPEAGGVWSTPIINYPESMIMGISRIADEVVVNEEREMEVASIMRLSFAFDHRLVDGVEAQSALAAFKKALGDPNFMLLKN